MMYGDNHIRYEHASRAKRLHVRCPKCNSRAEARQPSQTEIGVIAGDCSIPWLSDDWVIVCEHCMWRVSNLSYSQLPNLFYQVEARGNILWAWNRDHLSMLRQLLAGEDVSGHPYEWFATFARREWLQKKNRKYFLKEINRTLEIS